VNEPASDFELLTLRELAAGASKGPWRAMIEGRDHESGDSFIMIGEEGSAEDMYVFRDSMPAAAADLEFIAAARNLVPKLLDEIDQLRRCRDVTP
jgi:hypothetical protein